MKRHTLGIAVLLILIPANLAAGVRPRQAVRRAPDPVGTVELEAARIELPLDLATRRPVIEMTVDGEGPYRFVVDTGAGPNIIDDAVARRLGLPATGVQRVGSPGGEAVEAHRYGARVLAAGGLRIVDTELLGIDLAALAGDTFQGILGMRNLRDYLVTFDYPSSHLVVESGSLSAAAPGTVPYDAGGRLIRFDIDVDGVTVAADLDTGSAHGFTLPKAFEDRWTFSTPAREAGTARLVGAEHTVWRGRLDGAITVAGHVFTDPEVTLAEFTRDFANIGFEVLGEMTVTIDQRQGLLRLTRTGAEAPAAPPR
jgi:hypothetical protein